MGGVLAVREPHPGPLSIYTSVLQLLIAVVSPVSGAFAAPERSAR
jgi:hypothetical protein